MSKLWALSYFITPILFFYPVPTMYFVLGIILWRNCAKTFEPWQGSELGSVPPDNLGSPGSESLLAGRPAIWQEGITGAI